MSPKKIAENKKAPQRQTKAGKVKKSEIILSKWEGRFGNRMHQYAYGASYAKKNNLQLVLPSDWEGSNLFKNQPHIVSNDGDLRLLLNQTSKHTQNFEHRSEAISSYSKKHGKSITYLNPSDKKAVWNKGKNVWYDSICCYHKCIFEGLSKKFLKNQLFQFSDEVKSLDIYKRLEEKQGTYDIAHLRRDDISSIKYETNYGYSVISKKSYEDAFKKYGFDPELIEWTTDDWTGKWGVGKPSDNDWFSRRSSWRYPEGSEVIPDVVFDWLPDFLRIYFARSVFRANSSFSWWACLLGNQKNIYSPILTHRNIYSGSKGSGQESKFEFIDNNNPHWLILKGEDCDEIIIPD